MVQQYSCPVPQGVAMRMRHALLHLPHPMYSPAQSFLFIPSPSPRLPFSIPVICINILFHFVLSQSIIKGLLFHVVSSQTWTRVPSSTLVPSTPPPFPQRPSHVLKPTDQTQSPINTNFIQPISQIAAECFA